MCLILFALNEHPEYKLIFAANRDEFFKRPTQAADIWPEDPRVIGGIDKKSGGTWLGISSEGKIAAVTNYRDPKSNFPEAPSRGALTKNFLLNHLNAKDYLQSLGTNSEQYNGYNLLLRDESGVFYHYSNITSNTISIKRGIHGLSNHLLDTAWPKVNIGKDGLQQLIQDDLIDESHLLNLLHDDRESDNNELPQTGIPLELERKLSPLFIRTDSYGTRCSSVILINQTNQVRFTEVNFNERSEVTSKRYFEFSLNG